MSISSEANRNTYTGNDTFDALPYTFRITDETHVKVAVRAVATGVETPLTLTTHYTVDGVGDAGGGDVNLVHGAFAWQNADGTLKTGYKAVVLLYPPIKQESDFRNQGEFFPETHEDAFDLACRVDQRQQDEIDRSVKLPDSVSADDVDPTLPADIADNPGAAIVVNDAGDGLALGASSVDVGRYFKRATYAELKVLSAAAPTVMRWGFATDRNGGQGQLCFFCGDASVFDQGWLLIPIMYEGA